MNVNGNLKLKRRNRMLSIFLSFCLTLTAMVPMMAVPVFAGGVVEESSNLKMKKVTLSNCFTKNGSVLLEVNYTDSLNRDESDLCLLKKSTGGTPQGTLIKDGYDTLVFDTKVKGEGNVDHAIVKDGNTWKISGLYPVTLNEKDKCLVTVVALNKKTSVYEMAKPLEVEVPADGKSVTRDLDTPTPTTTTQVEGWRIDTPLDGAGATIGGGEKGKSMYLLETKEGFTASVKDPAFILTGKVDSKPVYISKEAGDSHTGLSGGCIMKIDVKSANLVAKSTEVNIDSALIQEFSFDKDDVSSLDSKEKGIDIVKNEGMTVTLSKKTEEYKDDNGNGGDKWVVVTLTSADEKKTPSEDKAAQEAADMALNKPTGLTTTQPVQCEGGGTLEVTYYEKIPFFGKKIDQKNLEAFFGKISIKYNDGSKEYFFEPAKVKVVRLDGGNPSENNASLVIEKIKPSDNSIDKKDKAFKTAQKAIKKTTKAKKGSLGKIPFRIYSMNVKSAVSAGQILEATVEGKSDSPRFTFKFASSKKKLKMTSGKKDSFKVPIKIGYDQASGVKIESGDIFGQLKPGDYTVKIKK